MMSCVVIGSPVNQGIPYWLMRGHGSKQTIWPMHTFSQIWSMRDATWCVMRNTRHDFFARSQQSCAPLMSSLEARHCTLFTPFLGTLPKNHRQPCEHFQNQPIEGASPFPKHSTHNTHHPVGGSFLSLLTKIGPKIIKKAIPVATGLGVKAITAAVGNRVSRRSRWRRRGCVVN